MPTLDDLKAEGYHGILAHCPGCRSLTELYWASIKAAGATELDGLKARLRCRSCGQVPDPEHVRPFFNDRASVTPRPTPPRPT